MTVWRPRTLRPDEGVRPLYVIAIHNYSQLHESSPPGSIGINIGELLEVLSESDHWYFGRRICRNPEEKGIFPKNYVNIRDCSVDRTGSVEVVSIVQPQLVQEITHTLREWGKHWKHLYVSRGEQFKIIEQRMRALIELRSTILSGKFPIEQLKTVQRLAIYTMDIGNRELNLDLTVRCSTTGGQIDPAKVSTCQLYNIYTEASENIRQRKQDTHRTSTQPANPFPNTSYSFFVSVRNFVCKMTEDAELLMSLYDGTLQKHFTESYVVRWSKDGLASDIDLLHNLKVLFTDLSTSDIKREKVFLVCNVIRVGGMEPQSFDNRRSSVSVSMPGGRSFSQTSSLKNGDLYSKSTHTMRRPLGIAVMDVTHIFSGQLDVDDDKHHCITFFPCEKDNLESLLKKIISNKDLKGDPKTGQGLWISVKLLQGDIKQIREELPHLVVGNVSIARKMGFPEVILPSDARNDLYLCLVSGCFTRGGGKSSDRNVQVTVRVCNQRGEMIPGVIYLGGGAKALDEYNSVIYYHEDRPKWYEIFKICVPIEEFKLAHVLFLFRHRSSNESRDKNEKPFAMSFTPLMQSNGTTLNDIQHCLRVYKVDSKKWPSDTEAATCYLSLLSQKLSNEKENIKQQKSFLSYSPKDSFLIETTVCSTKLTQNVELLGVLNWCDHDSEKSLQQSLISLQEVPGEEVVKFLQDILDALFSILTQANLERSVDSSVGSYDHLVIDNLVFECLLFVIFLVSDRKYYHFQPVLDLYIKESFCATLAYKKLCKVLSQMILEKADQEKNDVLLRSMKCMEYLMRFIVKSRELHAELTQKSDQHEFQQLFMTLLNSIIVMMQCNSKNALTSQGSCIKYLPAAVEYIIQVFPETELSRMIGNMFDVLPLNRLTKQRLMAVLDLVQGPLFRSAECRSILLPHITNCLKIIIQNNDETNKYGIEIRTKNRSVDKVARILGASKHKLQEHRGYSEELELCLKILSEILTLLFQSNGPTDREFNHISTTLLRTIVFMTSQLDRENPLMCQFVSVLFELFRQMNPERYNYLVSKITSDTELVSFLIEIQMLLKVLVEKPVYLNYWAEMINLQNNIILKTLKHFSFTLVEKFFENFHHQVWLNWFHLAISFSTQSRLQLEQLTSDQRHRLSSQYGDMRTEIALQIKNMWFNLGPNKIQFIPELVSPFLEMSLMPEIELRKATIPLFFDMMQCEYYSPKFGDMRLDAHLDLDVIKGNFEKFEDEMIHKLDALVEGGLGDAQWCSLFLSISGNQWNDQPELNVLGEEFVSIIGCLMNTLLQYRELQDHSNLNHRMQATTTLLDFYLKIKRPEMYIRYVNKLCSLHIECENWTEAALTLKLHAGLLQWSQAPLSIHLKSSRHPDCQTHRDLKEALYYDIIQYLDNGKMWELAVGVCKELVKQYEDEVFDYCNLSELHTKMANFYYAIMKQLRPQPEYYRVGYYGKGFPEFLQNREFIYRGKEYERLQDFCTRTLVGLPNAELMNKLTTPGEDLLNSPNQHVLINAVTPIMSDRSKLSGKQISDQILNYYKCNDVSKFFFSRRFSRQDEAFTAEDSNEFANMWVERTELEIHDRFPGILRCFPVVKTNMFEMSPLQVAIDSMTVMNRSLKELIIQHRSDTSNTLQLNQLTMKLNGIIDPAVMGGISNYEKVFFTEEYQNAHPECKGLIKNLKDLIACQIPLLEIGIEVHRSKLPPSLVPLHKRLTECFETMKAHVHEHYGKKSCELDTVVMRRQFSAMSNGFGCNGCDNRLSEISTQTNISEPSYRMTNSSLKTLTNQFNNKINRGSLTTGVGNNLGISASGLRSVSILTSPARRKDKEKRKTRKHSEIMSANSPPTAVTGTSQWYTGSIPALNTSYGTKSNSIVSEPSTPSTTTIRELRQEDLFIPHTPDVPLPSTDMPIPLNSTMRQINSKLVPSRPLRSEVEKEKRMSQRPQSFQSESNSNRNSAGTTDSSLSIEDDPPPLPQKTVKPDLSSLPPLMPTSKIDGESYYSAINFTVIMPPQHNNNVKPVRSANNTPVLPRQDYDMVVKPRGSFLYSSLQAKNIDRRKSDKAPTPPPKKRGM